MVVLCSISQRNFPSRGVSQILAWGKCLSQMCQQYVAFGQIGMRATFHLQCSTDVWQHCATFAPRVSQRRLVDLHKVGTQILSETRKSTESVVLLRTFLLRSSAYFRCARLQMFYACPSVEIQNITWYIYGGQCGRGEFYGILNNQKLTSP